MLPQQKIERRHIVISLADRVVMDPKLASQSSYAWERISGLQLSGGDLEFELRRYLLAQRDFALLADLNLHDLEL